MSENANIIYFSHGGGPLPLMGDESHRAMIEFMKKLPDQLPKPEVIVVLSAHWEEAVPTVLGAEHPEMFFDYYGFPEETYQIDYPAPGAPALAKHITELLTDAGISSATDSRRGFDHGLFIPLMMMYPEADIPAIQLSLIRGLNPSAHIQLGKALRGLLSENILFIGSGFSFHNQRAFFSGTMGAPDPANEAFQNWLIETCTGDFSEEEREQRLIHWESVPNARYCHPREEHLLPLHVCQALANQQAEVIFDDMILGKRGVAFKWEIARNQ